MRAESYFDSFMEKYINRENRWNYGAGCVMTGALRLYEATGEEKYAAPVAAYMERTIAKDGSIAFYKPEDYHLDNINNGKLLFYMYDRTGEERYRLAMDRLMNQLKSHPRCACGNFFHKKIYPYQVWLDGLYMALPYYAEYETRYDDCRGYDDILTQFENVRKYMYDEEKGLYCHGWDESREVFWADPETGRSANFWLRAIGWQLMAFLDVIDCMDKRAADGQQDAPECMSTRPVDRREAVSDCMGESMTSGQDDAPRKLAALFKEALDGILPYQDSASKLFWQVVDHPEAEGNYLETSGSAMVAYALLKGCRLGILRDDTYRVKGQEIVESLLSQKLLERGGELYLADTCRVAGLGPAGKLRRDGSVAYYLSEPKAENDEKGVGAFFMACAEYLRAGTAP